MMYISNPSKMRLVSVVFVVVAILVFTGCGPPNIEKLKANQDIKGLIKAIGYTMDAQIHDGAVKALEEIGEPAVEPLIEALNHKNPNRAPSIISINFTIL